MTRTTRPVGVTIVAVLLIITGVLGLIAGILAIVATLAGQGAAGHLIVLAVFAIVAAALNLIFAAGILRGNRVARMIVTIVQVLSVLGAVASLATSPAAESVWGHILNIAAPIVIILLLWAGDKTKAFFAR